MFIKNRLGLIESVETMLAQTQRLNQVSNNLANVDTNGYKRDNITFWEMLFTASDNRQRVGKALQVITSHQSGPAEQTNNPLDLAIDGEGFFRIQTPQGVRYTRAGNFHLNNQGQITTANGHLLLGAGGPVVVDGDKLVIDPTGRVLVDDQEVNQLTLATFADFKDLEKEGNNLFRAKGLEVQEQVTQDAAIQQGFLEGSNVDAVTELTEMIDILRAFESQQRAISIVDDLNNQAIRSVGKLTP